MNISSTLTRTLPVSLLTVGLLAATAPSSFAAVKSATELSAIQARGTTDISARTTTLATLIAKVNATTHLTATQKTALVGQMNTQVTELNALNVTLAADTDTTTAKIDFQDIFSQHYIYAFFDPTAYRTVAADAENDAASKFTALATKFSAYITTAQNKGDSVTTLQAQLADLQSKVADATTQSQTALNALTPLTAAGYPGNKTIVQGSSTNITTARADLKAAQADATNIIAGLKALLGTASATPTPTASPSASASAASAATGY